MHLLLASQRLDEGRLRGLESHLSCRVCLKTLSANESRVVLGTPDAYQLPNTPGAGLLRTPTAELVRFQTSFVSGPCPAGASPRPGPDPAPTPRVQFLQHHCDSGNAVAAGVRAAAEGCAALRDDLWQMIESKVATTMAIDDRGLAQDTSWPPPKR